MQNDFQNFLEHLPTLTARELTEMYNFGFINRDGCTEAGKAELQGRLDAITAELERREGAVLELETEYVTNEHGYQVARVKEVK